MPLAAFFDFVLCGVLIEKVKDDIMYKNSGSGCRNV